MSAKTMDYSALLGNIDEKAFTGNTISQCTGCKCDCKCSCRISGITSVIEWEAI